jgi:hypothetical protein
VTATALQPLLVLACALCCGCHLAFPFSFEQPDADTDADTDADATTPRDGAPREDLPDPHDLPDLATGDLKVNTTFNCSAPTPVNNMKDSSGSAMELVEASLTTDGSTLVARKLGSSAKYAATRSTKDAATFGPWSLWTSPGLDVTHEDFDFYLRGGKQRLLTAKKDTSGNRTLNDCLLKAGGAQCTPLSLTFAIPASLKDIDGPALADGLSTPELVFNLNDGTGTGGKRIYWATQSAQGAFYAAEVPVGVKGSQDDDPAISPGGKVVVFSSNRPGGLGAWDLYVTRHQPGTSSFSSPKLAQGQINSPQDDVGPDLDLVPLSSGPTLELYFSSNRSGSMVIYRTACSLK